MKNLEHNQANISTCMKNMETNQVNLGATLKNVKTQIEQVAIYVRENPPKFFLSDAEKNTKQCMVVTLRSGKELEKPKKIENEKEEVEKSNIEIEKEEGREEND